jgi:alanine dehydrogenase
MKTLLLTEGDVKRLLTMEESIGEVEAAFRMRGLGRTQMPPKQYLFFDKYNGDLRTMPSYLEDTDTVAVKVVNSHPENPLKHGLPAVMATILLVDPQTGVPKAIMGGNWITALRTGAAGAIAAKYLANPNSKFVGMVGAGQQARTQLAGLQSVFESVQEVRVWDVNAKASEQFAEEANAQYDPLNVVRCESVEETVKEADIVVTATPSRKPLIMKEWIRQGTHLNCIGADAPGKQELDPAILKAAKIVVDDWDQASHGGEINVAISKGLLKREDVWSDICQVVSHLKAGRTSPTEVTVFSSTGLAIQDAALASAAYSKALERNVGQFVEIMNT